MNFVNKRGQTPVVDFHQLNKNSVHHLDFGVEDVFTDRTKSRQKFARENRAISVALTKQQFPVSGRLF
jgi:hypothetical protein